MHYTSGAKSGILQGTNNRGSKGSAPYIESSRGEDILRAKIRTNLSALNSGRSRNLRVCYLLPNTRGGATSHQDLIGRRGGRRNSYALNTNDGLVSGGAAQISTSGERAADSSWNPNRTIPL